MATSLNTERQNLLNVFLFKEGKHFKVNEVAETAALGEWPDWGVEGRQTKALLASLRTRFLMVLKRKEPNTW